MGQNHLNDVHYRLSFIFLILVAPLSSIAQMGPPAGPPSIFTLESMQAENGKGEGVRRQTTATTGYPLLKSQKLSLITSLNFQDVQLYDRAFSILSHTKFQSLALSVNGTIQQESGDGWRFLAGIGSASDEIFANSRVLTFNVNVLRKNKLSDTTAFLYGFFYSNNATILPGIPIPTLGFEIEDKEKGDLFRIGIPMLIRQTEILPQTQWGLFAIGPFVWDVFIKNSSIPKHDLTLGIQKKPDTFLISESIPDSPLNQLKIEQTSIYTLLDFKYFSNVSIGLKAAYQFNNRFRLRETATTRNKFDLDRRFADYAFIGLNIKLLAPIK